MIRDWLYNHPPLEVGIAVVLLSTLAAWLGLYLFNRLVHVSIRSKDNDVAGFILAIVGVVHAVLLAFIAVAAWNSFDGANNVVRKEANLVGNLYRDSIAVPAPLRAEMRHDLLDYLDIVIHREWPAQQQGRIDTAAWAPLEKLHAALMTSQIQTLSQSVVEAEILKTLNELYSARRERLLAAHEGIPETIWFIIILGGVMTVSFSFFFGTHNMFLHYAMTGFLAASMALVMVLIVELDWPFRGNVSISADAFTAVQEDAVGHMAADGR